MDLECHRFATQNEMMFKSLGRKTDGEFGMEPMEQADDISIWTHFNLKGDAIKYFEPFDVLWYLNFNKSVKLTKWGCNGLFNKCWDN